MKFGTFKYITDSKNMFKKNYSLIAEGIIEMINHIKRTGFEAKLPEKDLIFKNSAAIFFHFVFHAQIPSFCFDLSAR